MHEFTVDYLTFSLRPDELAENRRDIDLSFVVNLLKLGGEWINFEHVGGRNGYEACYTYNDVLIHKPADEHYSRMGYCVMMKGNGMRWYASLFRNFDMCYLLRELVALTKTGLALNISRIDIALDDKAGSLDLDVIRSKALANEYVSTARTRQTITEYMTHKGDTLTGRTIYFGSRKSTAYIRIYDKAVEQGVSGHWIRVEFEFKQQTAMRIVNTMIAAGRGFPALFPQVANRYLRFIETDNQNRSRCSVSAFWSAFLGTTKRLKLSILPYKKATLSKLFRHVLHAYAPSLVVLLRSFPPEFFLDLVRRNGEHRLKQKHREMMAHPDIYDTPFSNSEKWSLETPIAVWSPQLAMSGV